jgi:predicted N-formylglutamate amidohydrolase
MTKTQHESRPGAPRSGPSPNGNLRVLITCEHAGNRVPEDYRALFRGKEELLASHRGWDPGAFPLARRLARDLDAPLRYSTTTRLLVDPNRSAGNHTLFSELTRPLPEPDRRRILRRYHRPYWTRVERVAGAWLEAGAEVLHLGIHTFTPVLDGVERTVDVGVLYDPERPAEARFAELLVRELEQSLPHLRIGRNVPYEGSADGLTTSLRRSFSLPRYVGIELEVCQRLMAGTEPARQGTTRGIRDALVAALRRYGTVSSV